MTRSVSTLGCLLFVCGLSLCSGGCLSFKAPTTTFRGVGADQFTPDGLSMSFDLNVRNPNEYYTPIRRGEYKLSLGGVRVIAEETHPDDAVPGFGATPVMVPVRLSYAQLAKAQPAIARGGDIPYDFSGTLEFLASRSEEYPFPFPGRRLRVPFRYTGTVSMQQALSDAANNPTVLRSPDARRFFDSVASAVPKLPTPVTSAPSAAAPVAPARTVVVEAEGARGGVER